MKSQEKINEKRKQIEEIVLDIISSQSGVSKNKISNEANLQTDINLDSLDIVEIVIDLEDRFGISIDEEHLEKFATINNIVDYIERKVK